MSTAQVNRAGIARTFQNIRLFSKLSVLDNVLIAKHMRAKQNVFSATFRLNATEEKRMREESLALAGGAEPAAPEGRGGQARAISRWRCRP